MRHPKMFLVRFIKPQECVLQIHKQLPSFIISPALMFRRLNTEVSKVELTLLANAKRNAASGAIHTRPDMRLYVSFKSVKEMPKLFIIIVGNDSSVVFQTGYRDLECKQFPKVIKCY